MRLGYLIKFNGTEVSWLMLIEEDDNEKMRVAKLQEIFSFISG